MNVEDSVEYHIHNDPFYNRVEREVRYLIYFDIAQSLGTGIELFTKLL